VQRGLLERWGLLYNVAVKPEPEGEAAPDTPAAPDPDAEAEVGAEPEVALEES
jgi:D-alanyl-D-alanine carboxypeptidase/D-alanyl-D-alanine-endopeptidase (penicillin-binding protein 4)